MNNFSPRAQQILALARKEADRFNHNYVGTEHLLLGLIKLGQGVAATVLQKMGLDLETVRIEVERQVGSGPDTKMSGNIPYTPRVKKVLALAGKEAKAMGHSYVGTEHILIGLLVEDDGLAARVLRTLGMDVARVRAEVLKELDPNFSSEHRTAIMPSSHKQSMVDFNLPPYAQPDDPPRDETRINFSPGAQKVLALARKEADRFNHNYVGTEHLLLGLTALGQGIAANVLQKLGFDLETIRAEVEKQVGLGPETPRLDKIPYSPRVKKTLALAGKEAVALGHRYVGTEHILLGLLREGDGVPARVLQALGVDLEKLRNGILLELAPNFALGERRPSTADEMKAKLQELSRRVEEVKAALRLKNEGDAKLDREKLLKELDDILTRLDSLRADVAQLRADILEENS
jgi:ATP-dependent Clp protease ATP-binding subunit ClpA